MIEDWRGALDDLGMRRTYRTLRVLSAIGDLTPAQPERGSAPSNREVADRAGISDPGQISRLLWRLRALGLIKNTANGRQVKGGPNAWRLTTKGAQVQRELQEQVGP